MMNPPFQPLPFPQLPVDMGGAGGGNPGMGGGLGALSGQAGGGPHRQEWLSYLTSKGWDGQGMPWQYAQSLRDQGQHPRWDFNHPGQPWPGGMGGATQGNGAGGGINPGGYDGSGINPGGMYGNGPLSQWQQPPHAMPGPMQGVAPMQAPSLPNGLMDLARKPTPFIQR